MLPRHLNNVPDNKKAKAPYNFVELPNDIIKLEPDSLPQQNTYYPQSGNRYTGKIECTLTTESPLYIRCGFTKEEFECGAESKDLLDFFYTQPEIKNLKPVIPGSSLRGMLRTLVEIITFSKIDRVSDKQRLFFRAVAANPSKDSLGQAYKKYVEPRIIQAGYLKKDSQGWYIQPAISHNGSTFAWVRETDLNLAELKKFDDANYCPQYIDVSYTKVNIDLPGTHQKKGMLVTSGNMKQENQRQASPRRNHCLIFECLVFEANPESAKLRIDNIALEHYRNSLTDFQQQTPFDKDWGILQEKRPVFYYLPEGSNTVGFFGQSPNFRIPYSPQGNGQATTVVDFIPEDLKNALVIDLADAIFGWIKDENIPTDLRQRGSRVFISDANYISAENDIWYTGNSNDTIIPKILSEPKPTCFQHYLVQPAETKADKSQLKHYASQPIDKTIIRGHKLYWHKGSNPDIEHPDGDNATGTQITKIKPIKAGVSFTFKIHLENLSDIELGAILWILKIAANPKYCLSLGMGKPLGMGAVKIEHELLLNTRDNRYSQLFNESKWLTGEENQSDTISKSEACIEAFEKYITDNIHPDDHPEGENAIKLDEIPRIQMLLLMLQCDNQLSADDTRYMTIEPNEYKDRPVLPTPFQVMGVPEQDKRRFGNINGNVPKPKKRDAVKISPKFLEGQILDAKVLNIKGVEVTYELPDGVKKTIKEHKKANFLEEGQTIKVKITALKDDGSIKYVKYHD
ncbi:MAG: TIGR03986 family CRISPR-associated RAMP protein [Cyanomargarita calcarea GSE-NOS-MK-12-04C]|jgi:CRISPR-associated protein (TIGR03986 family)|uniref:TIGR03986 family CRISPR-associated RAMP protein n=1 Tax=Cyanomargarita calcarea GSE-NOS-MK-12-04C TaxID=2839659 RepID=A0A951QSQ6_9CYAN|nr:TIGR03986 family CRISPR-associated RAMP protein [Cyanomargarita calcarea GSE-NOS-MK-12-04C]